MFLGVPCVECESREGHTWNVFDNTAMWIIKNLVAEQ